MSRRGSSISIGKGSASISNAKHNDRTRAPKYLIDFTPKVNEVSCSWQEVERKMKKIEYDVNITRLKLGKKKLSTQVFQSKEAVINLAEHHTLEDIKKISNVLTETFGIKILQEAVHKDEGIWVEKTGLTNDEWSLDDYHYDSNIKKWITSDNTIATDIKVYRPNENIHYSPTTEKWYQNKEYTEEFDMKRVHKRINYHGHILYSNLDEEGNTISRRMKANLTHLQDYVAIVTGLVRDKDKAKRKGVSHQAFKHTVPIPNI